jgi:hypothetical protein
MLFFFTLVNNPGKRAKFANVAGAGLSSQQKKDYCRRQGHEQHGDSHH